MKALEGATLERFFFTMNQVMRAAIIPIPAKAPMTPPAMAPALEPPPPLFELFGEFVVGKLSLPVREEVEEVLKVEAGGSEPVDSGRSEAALEATASHVLPFVTLRYAQAGMAVSVGIFSGYWVTKTVSQFWSHVVQLWVFSPWQAVHAMNSEYMTVLHSQGSADPLGGGT